MTNKLPQGVLQDVRAQPSFYTDDEIDLVDLWLNLARGRKLFFGVFGSVLVLTAILIVAMPRVYESRAVLQVGTVGSMGVLEQPQVVVERLIQKYRVNDTRIERPYPRIESVSSKKEQADIITIVSHGRTEESAREFLKTVIAEVVAHHDQVLVENTDLLRQRLEVLGERVKQSRELLDTLGKTAEAIKNSDARSVTTLLQEKTGLARELPQLEQDLSVVRASLVSTQTYPTRLMREPTTDVDPIRPRPLLYSALGVVLAGMAGVFSVFLSNFRSRLRERKAFTGQTS